MLNLSDLKFQFLNSQSARKQPAVVVIKSELKVVSIFDFPNHKRVKLLHDPPAYIAGTELYYI